MSDRLRSFCGWGARQRDRGAGRREGSRRGGGGLALGHPSMRRPACTARAQPRHPPSPARRPHLGVEALDVRLLHLAQRVHHQPHRAAVHVDLGVAQRQVRTRLDELDCARAGGQGAGVRAAAAPAAVPRGQATGAARHSRAAPRPAPACAAPSPGLRLAGPLPAPCSFFALKMIDADSSPTIDSTTVSFGRSTTVLDSSTCGRACGGAASAGGPRRACGAARGRSGAPLPAHAAPARTARSSLPRPPHAP
jgi:hypothetical protein